MLDHLSGQIEVLQTLVAQSENSRQGLDQGIAALVGAVNRLGQQMEAEAGQSAALQRIAEGQERLIAALTGVESAAHTDAESRMRLRSIDVQLLKILEEISVGRAESVADLRSDLTTLTIAVRQLARARG